MYPDPQQNKSLKPTAYVCHALCREAKLAPHYGGLVPPFYDSKK